MSIRKLKDHIAKHRSLFYALPVIFFVAFFDLLSKKLIFTILENHENHEIKVFDFFSLVQVWNRGVSFGMFNGLEYSHIIFSSIQAVIIFILFFLLYKNQSKSHFFAFAFIIGGAFGNLIDRIQNGAVADFLDFYIASYHWPAFNLADSFVFIGVVILLFEDILFGKKNEK